MRSILTLLILALIGGWPVDAQQSRATLPAYAGNPTKDEVKFEKFIITHLNQRVHLELSFGKEEMTGYKSGDADPFLGLRYSYFFDCLEKQTGYWADRCAALHFDKATNSLSGNFYLTEPRAKTLRTNRMFTLKPVK